MSGQGEKAPEKRACSLYIHIPFCAAFCDYCDFYSIALAPGENLPDRYIEALLFDVEKQLSLFRPGDVPTIYIGGGTPSLLGAAGARRLLGGLEALLPRETGDGREVTIEANPESADEPFLRACREGGVTRISLGVQSFFEPSRRAVHRAGEGKDLRERLALASEYYGAGLSVDLITGLPFQDEYRLLKDIEGVLSCGPGHVSLYALTAEPGTPLNVSALPCPDEADRLWIRGRDALEQAGYAQYEVSNFSLPGRESRHNIRYWRMENWLGAGPSASGTVIDDETGTGRRFTLPPDAEAYLAGRAPVLEENLDRLTLLKESLLMGFRYIEGPDGELFKKRFGGGIAEWIPQTLKVWRERGFLAPGKTALTREGLLFLDLFLIDAFIEIDSHQPAAAIYAQGQTNP
ncbi:MAG: radical SAM family heme chaperone HemW [Treponema sp.]|jgi:oxygen-independent coproporphyrinogen-3 oxidase|nr:radical SAM family heme chaperone HemW [Treponema sp.]